MRFSRLLREPILHFLLIGIALFVVYGQLAGEDRSGKRIVVSQALVDEMAREYQTRWMRTPGDQELSGLVETYVRDEILYREGVALGLDRDDLLIKRRVRQKLEVIVEEQGSRAAPSDADLADYMTKHPARFLRPATVSFDQILIEGTGARTDVERAIAAARIALARGTDPGALGQASILPGRVENTAVDLVARDFGAGFSERLATVPIGVWTGPVASGFGAHLVRVTARIPPVMPPLESVRPSVAREWENERRVSSRGASYQRLRDSYTVVVEARRLPSMAAR